MARIDVSVKSSFSFDEGKVRQKVKGALYQFAEEVMATSKDQFVPVKTGNLMSTGHVDLPVEEDGVISVTMGYGSTAVDYAASVHENMDPRVNWTRPGSGPKYLEQPLDQAKGELPGIIADAVKEGLS